MAVDMVMAMVQDTLMDTMKIDSALYSGNHSNSTNNNR